MKTKLYMDTHEEKSKTLLAEAFDLQITTLKTGDLRNFFEILEGQRIDQPEHLIEVEIKIHADGFDLTRLEDELKRGAANWAGVEIQRHAVWLLDMNDVIQYSTMKHSLNFYDFVVFADRFYGICHRMNVYPHIVHTETAFVKKIKNIFNNEYLKPLHVCPITPKALSQLACYFYQTTGVSEQKAAELALMCHLNQIETPIACYQQNKTFLRLCDENWPIKKGHAAIVHKLHADLGLSIDE